MVSSSGSSPSREIQRRCSRKAPLIGRAGTRASRSLCLAEARAAVHGDCRLERRHGALDDVVPGNSENSRSSASIRSSPPTSRTRALALEICNSWRLLLGQSHRQDGHLVVVRKPRSKRRDAAWLWVLATTLAPTDRITALRSPTLAPTSKQRSPGLESGSRALPFAGSAFARRG